MAEPGDIVVWGGGPAPERWTAHADSHSRAAVEADGAALAFSFELGGPGSFAIARCALAAELPAHWIARLQVRGEASAPVELQLKLVGAGGADVWWWRTPGFAPAAAAADLAFRRARLAFAWGPASGGEPRRIEAVELAVAGSGVRGRLVVLALRIEAREPELPLPRAPALRASSERPGSEAACVQSEDAARAWRPAEGDAAPWLELDLGRSAEWGGLAVDFAGGAAPACRLLASDDGERWRTLAEAPAGGPARQWLRTAEGEGRWLRLALAGPTPIGVTRAACVPLALAAAPVRHAEALARAAPRGAYPRHLLGEATTWALVAAEGDERKALLGADGALEPFAGAFSIEPFLYADGALATWADAETRPYLAEDRLPVPSVAWSALGLRLQVTAFAIGAAGASAVGLRYAVQNPGASARRARLLLAVRPFQVNPAWQGLNLDGGGAFAPIERIERTARGARVNGAVAIETLTPADAFGATPSDGEALAALLARGETPPSDRADDPLGFAEAAFAFDLALAPGESATIALAVPLHAAAPASPAALDRPAAARWIDARLAETEAAWRTRFARLPIVLPPAAGRFDATLHASLGWILINRDGPAHPARPALLRALVDPRRRAHRGGARRAGLRATRRATSCAGTRRTSSPTARCRAASTARADLARRARQRTASSSWAIVEYRAPHRRPRDPRASSGRTSARAVDAILERCAPSAARDAYRAPERRASGSCPSRSATRATRRRPVHSYWDDFFALARPRATPPTLATAASADAATRRELARAPRRASRATCCASIARDDRSAHGIDFLPGSVELGDFDPTSTAVALDPCGARDALPARGARADLRALLATSSRAPRAAAPARGVHALRVRNVGAFVRLGRKRARAARCSRCFIADQRPRRLAPWPEVVWRDPRAPRFLGDMPHGWVASNFVRVGAQSLRVRAPRRRGARARPRRFPEPGSPRPACRLASFRRSGAPLDTSITAERLRHSACYRFDGARPRPGASSSFLLSRVRCAAAGSSGPRQLDRGGAGRLHRSRRSWPPLLDGSAHGNRSSARRSSRPRGSCGARARRRRARAARARSRPSPCTRR